MSQDQAKTAIALLAALVVVMGYVFAGLIFQASCGPTQVAVVGWFGPECVARR